MVDKDKLELLFSKLPISFLREIAYKKEITIKTRSKDEFVKKLLENKWSLNEFQSYMDFLRRMKEEKKPISHYIAKIDSIDLESLKNKLEKTQAVIGEIDGRTTLISDGYEIIKYEKESLLKANEWTKEDKRDFGPFEQIIEHHLIKKTGFYINLKENLLFICDAPFQTARGIKNNLELFGVELKGVGLQEVARKEANKKFQDFVDELETKLKEGKEG